MKSHNKYVIWLNDTQKWLCKPNKDIPVYTVTSILADALELDDSCSAIIIAEDMAHENYTILELTMTC